jgi:hypothetical protein
VVQEADVLLQRRVVGGGERADQGVGEHHAAHRVVTEPLVDHLAERPGEQVAPGGVVVHHLPQLLGRQQRLCERREDALRHPSGHGVELPPGGVVGV